MKLAWKQITVTLLIGILVGFIIAKNPFLCRPWGPPSPEKKIEKMMKRLDSKLNLTPDQHQKVAGILETGRKKMTAFRDENRPKFDGIKNQTNTEIRNVLNPDQQPVFDKMQAEWEARMHKRRAKWEKR